MIKRKNILYYSFNNGYFVDVMENTISGRIDLFVYNDNFPEFKVQYPGPSGTLRQNFKTLESYILANAGKIVKEYHKEPYIRNRCDKPLPVIINEKTVSLSKMFHNIYFAELDGGYSVEVEEIQNFQNETMIRNYFICDSTQTYKFRIINCEGELAGFTPMDELISEKHKEWISEQKTEVVDAICNELKGIGEFMDETEIGGYSIKMFSYTNGGFCVHTFDGDMDMFYKFDNAGDAYRDFYNKAEVQFDKINIKNTTVGIRKRLNRCRKHIADKNGIMFAAEMGVIKGLLYSYGKNSIEILKIVPEEKFIMSFIKKYEEMTKDTFLDLSF